jgi:hypothetical protein
MTVASRWTGLATVSTVLLRLALGISFLSAVADRFGFWGVYGQPNVSWGNYARFVDYTAKLNWFLPAAMIVASIYSSIDSRRPPQVFVMEPTDAWLFHHPPLNRWLHTPPLGRVLAQR